jgi:transposase
MDQYVSIRIATQITGIQAQTLRKMADRKEIRCFKTPSGQRKFNSQDLQNMLNNYTDKSLPVETEKKITYILGSLLKNKWMIFLDKLNSLDLAVMNILPTFLLRTLLQELTLKEKAFKPDTNGLKFFQFKQRLEYKAKQRNKLLILVQEQYTTKTCSNCGVLNEVGIRKTYTCTKCNVKYGRDLNAAKNILIKGLISS